MFASFHPFPSNTLLATTVVALALPPLFLRAWHRNGRLPGWLQAVLALGTLVTLLVVAGDLHNGWRWRTFEPHRPAEGYGLPWWYLAYWQVVLWYAFTALGISVLTTCCVATVTRWARRR
jgi:hypothetical protein